MMRHRGAGFYRRSARRALTLLVAGGVVGVYSHGPAAGGSGESEAAAPVPQAAAHGDTARKLQASVPLPPGAEEGRTTVVYYFHRTFRCPDCLMAERYVRDLLETDFAEPLERGRLIWTPLDFEQPDNAPYVDAFGLGDGPAVILSRWEGGKLARWRNLLEVWDLVEDAPRLVELVRGEIAEFLADKADPGADGASPEPSNATESPAPGRQEKDR